MRGICCISLTLVAVAAESASAADLVASDRITETQQVRTSERTVGVDGATSIRVRFEAASIAPGARISIVAEDGDVQHFDQTALQRWGLHSAIFNGSSVKIRIEAPTAAMVNYAAEAMRVEFKAGGIPTPGVVIDTDERIAVRDPRVGRIMPMGCTGWLTALGAVLTAGHCQETPPPRPQVLQFNVPTSRPDGTTRNPPADDQYPLASVALYYGCVSPPPPGCNPPPGRDWQIMRVGANATGSSVYDRQKSFFRLSNAVPSASAPVLVQVTGYGTDSYPLGTGGADNAQSQTEQTDVGLVMSSSSGLQSACVDYVLDTQGGASGSPIFWSVSGVAIGIHTNGVPCQGNQKANSGTLLILPEFGQALGQFPAGTSGKPVVFVDGEHPAAASGDGTVFLPYQRFASAVNNNKTGGCPAQPAIVSVAAGHYEGFSFTLTNACPFKLIAPSGPVLIGPRPLPLRNP